MESQCFGRFNLKRQHATALCDRDSTVVQPTGCEKSFYYQLVSLQSKKMVFVFTPMVALMYDQVRHLQNGVIPAIALGAEIPQATTTSKSITRRANGGVPDS